MNYIASILPPNMSDFSATVPEDSELNFGNMSRISNTYSRSRVTSGMHFLIDSFSLQKLII